MIIEVALHSVHLLCAIFWFGSLLWTEIILWPQMRKSGQLESVQGALRSVAGRKVQATAIAGTIITGFARGVVGGVFERLYTPYGVMFLLSAVLGVAMLVWWSTMPSRSLKLGWRLYYISFWPVFGMMVGMHFTS